MEIRDKLKEIWEEKIKTAYMSGNLCSERALQAELYKEITEISNNTVWVEPTIKVCDPKNTLLLQS